MDDSQQKTLPGTATTYDKGERGFTKIAMLLEATGGLSLSQVCAVTGLEASTIQNWVKRSWVAHPKGKKYEDVHIARILIINALKECIKLEHISLLLEFVNGSSNDSDKMNIKESELFNYLCDALDLLGRADDLSKNGVEDVVERVLSDYEGPTPYAVVRIKKAMTLMLFACVCTDVKRRTEAMMQRILYELEHPESVEIQTAAVTAEAEETSEEEEVQETHKTVSQALREWDTNDSAADNGKKDKRSQDDEQSSDSPAKVSKRPWNLWRSN